MSRYYISKIQNMIYYITAILVYSKYRMMEFFVVVKIHS